MGSGCCPVGRVVASDSRGPWFESSHRQKFIFKLAIFLKKKNIHDLYAAHHGDGSPDVRMNANFSKNSQGSDLALEVVRVQQIGQHLTTQNVHLVFRLGRKLK